MTAAGQPDDPKTQAADPWATAPGAVQHDDEPGGSMYADTSDRFATDTLLRKHGWAIASRPRVGEPLWVKAGEVKAESQILPGMDELELGRAETAQAAYYERVFA